MVLVVGVVVKVVGIVVVAVVEVVVMVVEALVVDQKKQEHWVYCFKSFSIITSYIFITEHNYLDIETEVSLLRENIKFIKADQSCSVNIKI